MIQWKANGGKDYEKSDEKTIKLFFRKKYVEICIPVVYNEKLCELYVYLLAKGRY